ncbi:MFS transporter [Flindersiella endophytica]
MSAFSALRYADFRRLWLGSSLSALGDGMTWTAFAWIVLTRAGSPGALGWLAICYTAPVLLGGAALGPLLDRFPKRTLLLADSLVRAVVIGSIPLLAFAGRTPLGLVYVAAGVYGLLKMLPLAGVPAAIPDLLPERELSAANGLETFGYGVAGLAGPAIAGLLIPLAGAENVLAVDAASYLVFAFFLLRMGSALPPPAARPGGSGDGTDGSGGAGWAPSIRSIRTDRTILATTVAFMAFNVAEGMLLVALPWLAKEHWDGGATSLGTLLTAIAVGELAGSIGATRVHTTSNLLRYVALAQLVAAGGFLAVLLPAVPLAAGLLVVLGVASAPMTVWAQSIRMLRLPAEQRGRIFTILRTCMQFTPPLGAALAAPLLARDALGLTAAVMVTLAALPGAGLLLAAVSRRPTRAGGCSATDRPRADTPSSTNPRRR